ncbi:MAG TPA: GNAT family protein [Candidatus Limnocylindria bacterium]|nr:GNAT family protein [Candidatus Limnocylindria bacterium]
MFGGTVRGKKTTLRVPSDADLDAHKRWAADMRVRRAGPVGRWHEPAATATWKERWTEQAKDKSSVLWSIRASGAGQAGDELVGYARIRFDGAPHADSIGIDQFVIDPAHERKGYGWDAALTLHRWAFDFMNMRLAVIDRVAADDAGRQRILERLGYVRFGHGHAVYYRDGAYVDQYFYQMERDIWNERWPDEREYPPLGEETER